MWTVERESVCTVQDSRKELKLILTKELQRHIYGYRHTLPLQRQTHFNNLFH